MTWTESRLQYVRDNWGKISVADIADAVGKTRNAVIGMAHRMKCKKLTRGAGKHIRRKRLFRAPPRALPEVVDRITTYSPATHNSITIANVKDSHCRWPIGNPREKGFMFCGAEAVPTKPYCEEHCRICYVNAPKRERGVVPVCVQVQADVVIA